MDRRGFLHALTGLTTWPLAGATHASTGLVSKVERQVAAGCKNIGQVPFNPIYTFPNWSPNSQEKCSIMKVIQEKYRFTDTDKIEVERKATISGNGISDARLKGFFIIVKNLNSQKNSPTPFIAYINPEIDFLYVFGGIKETKNITQEMLDKCFADEVKHKNPSGTNSEE